MKNYKIQDTSFEHFYIGKCHNLDLNENGTNIEFIVQRKNEDESPVFLGMMVSIVTNEKDKFFLGRVESIKPDLANDMYLKDSLRSSIMHNQEIDTPYKKEHYF